MNGRPDYDVGDLVVCVNGRKCRVPAGTVWRVQKIIRVAADLWGVVLVGKPAPAPGIGWHADHFRKVDPLPDSLTELLASKPVRDRVSA